MQWHRKKQQNMTCKKFWEMKMSASDPSSAAEEYLSEAGVPEEATGTARYKLAVMLYCAINYEHRDPADLFSSVLLYIMIGRAL
ncbi:phage gp6-like head-tail connector protein [Paenibacillaceae bacterium]|nr:phage gp6-like head-tail connector protein [Paenibacillaceae bacterium]